MIINTTCLSTVRTFANKYGMEVRGEPYSKSLIYYMFDLKNGKPEAVNFRKKYALVVIDGVQFVTLQKHVQNAKAAKGRK